MSSAWGSKYSMKVVERIANLHLEQSLFSRRAALSEIECEETLAHIQKLYDLNNELLKILLAQANGEGVRVQKKISKNSKLFTKTLKDVCQKRRKYDYA